MITRSKVLNYDGDNRPEVRTLFCGTGKVKSWEVGRGVGRGVGRVILSRWRSGVRFGSQKPFGVGGEPPA